MHWKCTVCNFLWEGESPPDTCPKCGWPGEKYEELSEDQWKLIERARFSNGLYNQLLTMIPELQEIAREGLDDNLDPWCVDIFQRLLDETTFLEKSIKAEINVHVNKGKWG